MAPLLAEVIRAVYLNQSVSPCYNLITPEVQAKKKEEVEKIMKEKEASTTTSDFDAAFEEDDANAASSSQPWIAASDIDYFENYFVSSKHE